MSSYNLRTFLKQLDDAGEILHIEKEVDPRENLAALAWQGENVMGKATFFENLKNYPGWRAVSYADASRKRLALAVGTTPREFIPRMNELLKLGPTPKHLVETGPVKEVIKLGDDVDLNEIPIHIMSNLDAGPYIGGAMAVIKDPDTGIQNVSLHRHQLKGKNKLGVLMHPGRHMDMIYHKYEERKENMPIALAIGHHGVSYLTTCWTFPYGVDEFEMAGTFMQEPMDVVRCETQPLEVPADAEIIIEGYVPPFERENEGPFAEHTGYARAGAGMNPYIIVTAITMRKDPIYYALQGGKPIASSQILDGMPMEIVLYNRIKDVGGYVDVHDVNAIPCAGGSHIIVAQITPKVPGEAKDVAMAILSSPYLHPKYAIICDDDVDIHNEKEIIWSLSTRVNPEKDIIVISGGHGHQLDASLTLVTPANVHPQIRRGSKVIIDATKPSLVEPDARDHFTRSHAKGSEFTNILDYIKR